MIATKCLQHPWMKARSADLSSSTSSLDSAVCIDSTEASPSSSTSSSFGPAPTVPMATSVPLKPEPEDITKFSQRLSTEMSSLATNQCIADSTPKTLDPPILSPIEVEEAPKKMELPPLKVASNDVSKTEGAPAPPISPPLSTGSSTSTLQEGDSSESIPALKEDAGKTKAAKEKLDVTDSGIEKEVQSTSPKPRNRDEIDDKSNTRYKYSSSQSTSESYTPRTDSNALSKSVSPGSSFKSKYDSPTKDTVQSDVSKPKLKSKSSDAEKSTISTKKSEAVFEKDSAVDTLRSSRETCTSPTKREQRPSSRSSNSDKETEPKKRIGSGSSDVTHATIDSEWLAMFIIAFSQLCGLSKLL